MEPNIYLCLLNNTEYYFAGLMEAIGSLDEKDLFDELQNYPQFFQKGGSCYEEVIRTYGNSLTDNMHIQFREMKRVVFRFNQKAERLEVCLGLEHVPVGPLTPQQRDLCRLAAAGNQHKSVTSSAPEELHSIKWLVNKHSSTSVKAFSGTGHTLGGSGSSGGGGGGGGEVSTSAAGASSMSHIQQQAEVLY